MKGFASGSLYCRPALNEDSTLEIHTVERSTKEICFTVERSMKEICTGKPDFLSLPEIVLLRIRSSMLSMPLPYCVYVLFSYRDRLLYIGYTTNIEKRINNHNCGKTKSTTYRRPLELIFCEFYLFEADAKKREMYFKTTAGKKAIKLMLGGTLSKFGYNASVGIDVACEEID